MSVPPKGGAKRVRHNNTKGGLSGARLILFLEQIALVIALSVLAVLYVNGDLPLHK